MAYRTYCKLRHSAITHRTTTTTSGSGMQCKPTRLDRATNIMRTTVHKHEASKPQSEANITHARTEPNFMPQRPSGANSRVDRGHPRSLATACRKQAARVAAARSLASEWAAEGQGVDRARWLGMEKVCRVRKECGVALTGSGGRGHGQVDHALNSFKTQRYTATNAFERG